MLNITLKCVILLLLKVLKCYSKNQITPKGNNNVVILVVVEVLGVVVGVTVVSYNLNATKAVMNMCFGFNLFRLCLLHSSMTPQIRIGFNFFVSF